MRFAERGLFDDRATGEIYARRDFKLPWTDAAQIERVLLNIRRMEKEGLTPSDFHLESLEPLQGEITRAEGVEPTSLLTDRDLLLTDALIRLCYHLLFGKVDPVYLSVTRISPGR